MFWDTEEAEAVIKRPPVAPKVHAQEVISAFGSTDTVSAVQLTPDALRELSTSGAYDLNKSGKSPTTPVGPQDYARRSEASSDAHRTLNDHQRALPRLPIPDLRNTCDLYLKSLQGIANAEEFERSCENVEEFLGEGGVGQQLQALLLAREKDPTKVSWFEEFWDDAYLCTRDALPININYFFGLEVHQKPECMTQVGRAASLLHAAVTVHAETRDGTLTVDTERGKPLCMSQYRRVFCASRVPGEIRDSITTFTESPLNDDDTLSATSKYERMQPKHAVVMIRNRMFAFDVLDELGDPLPLAEIAHHLTYICEEANQPGSRGGPPVGVFTTLNRNEWFEVHENLRKLGKNEKNLKLIRSAIMVVCLDQLDCDGADEAARVFLHGTGTNRWFDRHNLIVTPNGWAGINFEHSVGDGATTLRVADTMFRRDAELCPTKDRLPEFVAHVAANREKYRSSTNELHWTLDGTLDAAMKTAFDEFVSTIRSNETSVLHFTAFGGNYIKLNKLSPDAFVQVSFQLAYHRIFGRCDATYEAASTRGYLHGRTEVVRSTSRAVVDFCESSSQPLFSHRVGSKVPAQLELLRDAVTEHVEYMKKAKSATGVDRHLLGLRMMCAEAQIETPALFTDPLFTRSCHWNLSTSHCGSSALNLFGFGPVVFDGFGLGYMIKNDSIDVVITSKYTHQLTSSSIFADTLHAALMQMKTIVDSDQAKKKTRVSRTLEFAHPTAISEFEYDPNRGFSYKTARSHQSLYTRARAATPANEGDMVGSSSSGYY